MRTLERGRDEGGAFVFSSSDLAQIDAALELPSLLATLFPRASSEQITFLLSSEIGSDSSSAQIFTRSSAARTISSAMAAPLP